MWSLLRSGFSQRNVYMYIFARSYLDSDGCCFIAFKPFLCAVLLSRAQLLIGGGLGGPAACLLRCMLSSQQPPAQPLPGLHEPGFCVLVCCGWASSIHVKPVVHSSLFFFHPQSSFFFPWWGRLDCCISCSSSEQKGICTDLKTPQTAMSYLCILFDVQRKLCLCTSDLSLHLYKFGIFCFYHLEFWHPSCILL